MVESPVATAIIRTTEPDGEDPDAPLLSADEKRARDGLVQQELLLVQSKPITSSLRATIRHLRARAGWASPFRGLKLFALYNVVFHFLSTLVGGRPGDLAYALSHVGTTVLLCRVNMAWTHAVISEPTGKSIFSRIVDRHAARRILAPTAVYAIIEQVAIMAPAALFQSLRLWQYTANPELFRGLPSAARTVVTVQFLAVGLVGLAMGVFVLFPAHVALRRVQASLLPEEDESIVPFDRSFGGKVVPEIVGGSGRVRMREAWTSFDWNARVRLIKVYLKMFAMEVVVAVAFVTFFMLQAKLLLGPELDRFIAKAMRS